MRDPTYTPEGSFLPPAPSASEAPSAPLPEPPSLAALETLLIRLHVAAEVGPDGIWLNVSLSPREMETLTEWSTDPYPLASALSASPERKET